MLKFRSFGACKMSLTALTASLLLACQTTKSSESSHDKEISADAGEQRNRNRETEDTTKAEIASLRAEIQSLQERMSSAERNMQTILRGARSGMWDSQPSPHVDVPVEKPAVSTSAPASENAHTGPTRSLISPIRAIEPPTSLANTEGSALKRIAYAETKMNSGDVNEALSILEEVATEFPNIADNGKTQLLHADCSLRLKNPENALTSIRRFYLKYPKSSDTMSAKILEASAHIELGNHERAIAVYREVIALAPRSSQAQTARSALQKLRDER